MIDVRLIEKAKTVFSKNIKHGRSVETAIINTARFTGFLVDDVWDQC